MSSNDFGLVQNLIANLGEIGVSSESIGFANVSMHSEKFVCVRENKHSSKSSLKIIDLRKGTEVSEKPMTADSAIMNPSKPHLALRAQNTIQVFNIDTKTKISSLQVGFEIIFWNWVDEKTLVLVSDDSIFLWDYETLNSVPTKWFEKGAPLIDCQIINAEIDKSSKWGFISGISLKNGKIIGTIQLYNDEKKVSQIIEGHAGHFVSLKTMDKDSKSETSINLFAFATRAKSVDLKLNLIQIDPNENSPHFAKRIVDLPLCDLPENDFPIKIVYDSVFCLIFVYTKFGTVYVVEPESGVCVMDKKISDSPLFLITSTLNCNGHFILNRKGDIINISIDIEPFFSTCIHKGEKFYEPVGIFMNNLSLERQAEIYRNQFDNLKNSSMYQEALLLVAKSGKPFLRTFEYLSSIKDFPSINETSALLEYFALVLESGKLNEVESLELVQLALNKKKLDIVRKWLAADQIFCTSQLGKVVLESDPELALKIFENSNSEAMVLHCLAILGRLNEFSSRIKSSSIVDCDAIINVLLKTNIDLVPEFISAIAKVNSSKITDKMLQMIFNTELGSFSAEIDKIIANCPNILLSINSQQINTQIAIRLVDSNPNLFSQFILACEEHNLELSRADILPLLKRDKNLSDLAFSFESNLDECINLADQLLGKEESIKSTNLSKSDVKKIIFRLIEKDSVKYERLCAKMSEFIDESDIEEIKILLKANVREEHLCDFIIFWSQKLKSNFDFNDDILISAIKLEDEARLIHISQCIDLSNPIEAFNQISSFNYKSHALKIVASKYKLHNEIMFVFESKNDNIEAKNYLDLVGQEVLWINLNKFLENGLSEDFLKSLLECPNNPSIVINTATELEKNDKLIIISDILKANDCFPDNIEVFALKLKILAECNDDLFCELIKNIQLAPIIGSIMQYCEKKNPDLALKYYLSTNDIDEILRIAFKFENWEYLTDFLINYKNSNVWSKALNYENSIKLFGKLIEKASSFPDSESASCLIKVLSSRQDSESLLKIMGAWLGKNEKLKSSKSLQTLYLLHLIKNKSDETEEVALQLDNYNAEEIVHAALDQNELDLCLKILRRYEQWNYAFKVALYGFKNIVLAQEFAERSGHPEAWHALADFCLITGDAISAVNFSSRSGNFRRQKELVILLHLEELYQDLLNYLLSLKSSPHYEPIYEREIFLCLVKLGKTEELHSFISNASSSFANELGKVLYREGSIELAARCFKQSGNYDKASLCYLQLGNIEEAAESALKTSNFEIWIDIIKFSLNAGKFDISRKFGLRCSQQYDRIEDLFNVYENCGAYDNMIEIIETILESSAPQQQVMLKICEIYCREFPEKLEAFINKYYSSIQISFVQVLTKYRRWKEAFKLLLLRSNLDEALELVIKHPSIEFDHHKLTAVLGKIRNQKVLEHLLQYYYECDPRMLLELQEEFSERFDISSLIKFFKEKGILFILNKTMRKYQTQNPGNVVVSMGLNEHFLQINDYYGLIESIKKCPSIDAVNLSDRLKNSEQRHFRVLAAKLMANSGDFIKALSILVEEDALIETLMILSQSSNVKYAEAILVRYSRIRNAVMFMAVSYVLYDFIHPDVIYELSQRAKFRELCLPLFCQIMRHKLK